MASLARSIDLQRADGAVVMSFKSRLIDYLQRFIGDLVTRSSQIAELLESLMSQLAAAGARLRYHGRDPSLAGVMAEGARTIHEEAVSDLLLEDLRAETHDTR